MQINVVLSISYTSSKTSKEDGITGLSAGLEYSFFAGSAALTVFDSWNSPLSDT